MDASLGTSVSGQAADTLIRRTHDAAFLNEVANHPAVRPWLGPGGAVDMTPQVKDPLNFTFQSDHGGVCFLDRNGGVYEAHYHFLPECWGAEPRAVLAQAVGFMFAETGCEEIVVQAPRQNVRSKKLLAREGFRYRGLSGNTWTDGQPLELYGLTQIEWCDFGDASCPG